MTDIDNTFTDDIDSGILLSRVLFDICKRSTKSPHVALIALTQCMCAISILIKKEDVSNQTLREGIHHLVNLTLDNMLHSDNDSTS